MPTANRFGLGVFLGLNYSYPLVSTRFPVHFESQNNFLAGIDLHYYLNDRAALHIQPSWTRVSDVKPKNSWSGPVFNFTMVRIPLVYRYYILPSRRLLFVQAGVSYNHLTNSNFREELDVVCIAGPCPKIIGPTISPSNRSTVSGIAGIGINIDLQKISVPITFQYERYVNGYLFPNHYDAQLTPVKFESFALTTGINFWFALPAPIIK